MSADRRPKKPVFGIWPLGCTVVFVGYLLVVLVNVPPLVKSDNISVHWNLLYIAGAGVIGAVTVLAAVAFGLMAECLGRVSTRMVMIEAISALVLSVFLLHRALSFFTLI